MYDLILIAETIVIVILLIYRSTWTKKKREYTNFMKNMKNLHAILAKEKEASNGYNDECSISDGFGGGCGSGKSNLDGSGNG